MGSVLNVIQHNMMAMFSDRQLGITTNNKAKSTEKLSSGYRINRAADDAAGLSISEKMRRQIRGLNQASANCQDGISMVQTADGAMEEIHDMLHRCSELSIKAANGTLSQSDRQDIQHEIDQIRDEIDGIADRTKFNEIFVLKGVDGGNGGDSTITYIENGTVWKRVQDGTRTIREVVYNKAEDDHVSEYIRDGSGIAIESGKVYERNSTFTMDFGLMNSAQAWEDMDGTGFCFTCTAGCGQQFAFTFDYQSDVVYTDETTDANIERGGVENNKHYTIGTKNFTNYTDLMSTLEDILNDLHTDGEDVDKVGHINTLSIDDSKITLSGQGSYMDVSVGVAEVVEREEPVYKYVSETEQKTITQLLVAASGKEREGLSIHAGADSVSNNKIDILLPFISSKVLGISDVNVTQTEYQYDDDLGSLKEVTVGANNAIDKFANAIFYVNEERARMGAYQNRMEHTIKNLDNTVENTTASESRIRDTDMASEMVRFSNYNILQQAGQSMLTQANQSRDFILSLLQ